MPRQMRAARFFWKMPRYTTSQVKCAMPSSSNITLGAVGLTARLVGWSDHTVLAPETAVKTTYRLGEDLMKRERPGGPDCS